MNSATQDPAGEIRITALHATRGINYWSTRPVVRLDLTTGAYEDISSAQVPGFTDALIDAMPGLREHHCSIGAPGGFVKRLRRGTYAPHIIEHVALELQTMIGHEVGYGRTRGGDEPGEYTLVFEHRHEHVGLRAAALALAVVQRAFAGTLDSVELAVQELAALSATPDTPPLHQHVLCGVTGGTGRVEAQHEIARRMDGRVDDPLIIDVSPAYLLRAGLPYSHSEAAVVLDTTLTDVPERYAKPERARRLVSTLAHAVRRGGFVICPAKEWEIQDYAREHDCRVAIFATDDDVTARDARVASAAARVRGGCILVEAEEGDVEDCGPLADGASAAAQVAGVLAAQLLPPAVTASL